MEATTIPGAAPGAETELVDDPGITGPSAAEIEAAKAAVVPPEGSGVDQEPDPEPQPAASAVPQQAGETVSDVVDTLQPRYEAREITLVDTVTDPKKPIARTYVQRPLSFMGKMEFFALIGETIDAATQDSTIDRLLDQLGFSDGPGGLGANDLKDATMILRAMSKLMRVSPRLLDESFAIWLDIPMDERPWASSVIRRPATSGGLKDDDALAIIETFIDQNAEEIEDFFDRKLRALGARARLRFKRLRGGDDPSSKQSKPSQPSTEG